MSGDPGPAVAAPTQQQTQAPAQGAEHTGGGEHAAGGGHDTSFSTKGPIPPVAAGGSAAPNKPSASDQAYGAHDPKPKAKQKVKYVDHGGGYTAKGKESTRDALTRLVKAGKLNITGHEIAQLDGLSQVETSGAAAAVDTTDDQVVSLGFHQVVLGHKSLEWVIQRASAAFAKHGIELDMSATYEVDDWSHPHQIKGVENPFDLRGHLWGDRFLAACLEDEVLAAIAEWAIQHDAKRVDGKVAGAGGHGAFWNDDTARAWMVEVENNRPGYTAPAAKRAVALGANSAKDREAFLDILGAAIIDAYEDLEPKLVGYKKLKHAHHDWDDAKLHEEAEKKWRPIGKTKATHIIEKISRHLKVPTVDATASAAPAQAPAPAPAPVAAAPAQVAEHHDAPPPVAHHEAPAPKPAHHDVVAAASTAPAPVAPTHHDVPAAEHAPEAHATSPHAFTGPAHLRVKATGLNVRSSPTTHRDNIVGGLHHGESLEALDREGDWIAITYKGQRAYVHGGFVEATPMQQGPAHTPAPTPVAHHDAPKPEAAKPAVAHAPQPEHHADVEARPSPAATRPHHEATPAAHHDQAVVAAPHATAAPTTTQAPEESPQAKHDRLLQAEHAAILKDFDAGKIDVSGAMDRIFAFERMHNDGNISGLGYQLIYTLPAELGAHMETHLAHVHHDAPAPEPHHDAPPNAPAHTTPAPAVTPKVAPPAQTAHPQVAAGTFETANHNVIAKTTPKDEAVVLNDIRKSPRRFDPAWLIVAQANLGVTDASGAMNTETLRAMRNKSGRHLSADEILNDSALLASFNAVGHPFFPGSETGDHQHKPPKPGADSNKDKTVQELGFESFEEYSKLWGTDAVQFMGHDFGTPAHPYLRARLKVAEAYLRQRITGPNGQKLSDAEITKRLGWNLTGKESYGNASYGHKPKDPNTHQHAMGLAVDIQPAQNAYMFESASGWMEYFENLSIYAKKMFGGEALHPATLKQWSNEMSTEELYTKVKSGSDAFAKLLQYSHGLKENEQDPDLIEKVEAMGYKGAEAKKVAHQIALADKDFHLQEGRRNAAAPMNLNEEMLIALRDVAGLAWGGAEIAAGENGDMMHFDCRNTDFGLKVYNAGWKHKPQT